MSTSIHKSRHIRDIIHRNLKFIAWIIIMLSMAILNELRAQNLYGSLFAQNTIAGLQQGTEVGVMSQKQFGVGLFFQAKEVMSLERSIDNYPYYGLTFQAPIKSTCNGVSFYGQVKTGVVNHDFVVVTPQLETQLDITPFMKVGFSMGYRAGHSAVGARIILHI